MQLYYVRSGYQVLTTFKYIRTYGQLLPGCSEVEGRRTPPLIVYIKNMAITDDTWFCFIYLYLVSLHNVYMLIKKTLPNCIVDQKYDFFLLTTFPRV